MPLESVRSIKAKVASFANTLRLVLSLHSRPQNKVVSQTPTNWPILVSFFEKGTGILCHPYSKLHCSLTLDLTSSALIIEWLVRDYAVVEGCVLGRLPGTASF